jgi:hypothetical protein
MAEPQIRDIPSIQNLLTNLKNMAALKDAMPVLAPMLKLSGVDTDKIEGALAKVAELEHLALELAAIPDRFNDLFAERGWIINGSLNLEVAKSAINKAECGEIEEAEGILVDYYNPETVQQYLRFMATIDAFRDRIPLAQKALTDYREERYHACVPVVLALLDGMVNELHETHRNFFADGTDLEAWDSITAHSRGLGQLVKLMTKSRQTTITEQIRIPYRNGIMHGMDLGYDNKIVAAKTWAALFAARDWAIKAEQGLLKAPLEKPEKTWQEILQQLRDNADVKAHLKAWEPRTLLMGENVPITGQPDVFEDGTPERRLSEFLTSWKAKNYGYMARCLPARTDCSTNKRPLLIREVYASKTLKNFQFVEIVDKAPSMTEIQTKVIYTKESIEVEELICFRMINEDDKGQPTVRGKAGSSWNLSNWRTNM